MEDKRIIERRTEQGFEEHRERSRVNSRLKNKIIKQFRENAPELYERLRDGEDVDFTVVGDES